MGSKTLFKLIRPVIQSSQVASLTLYTPTIKDRQASIKVWPWAVLVSPPGQGVQWVVGQKPLDPKPPKLSEPDDPTSLKMDKPLP